MKWNGSGYAFTKSLLSGHAARLWHNPHLNVGLCPCLAFAICGRCEHEKCIDGMEGVQDLSVPGNQRPGRPGTVQWVRGSPSHRIFSRCSTTLLQGEVASAGSQDVEAANTADCSVGQAMAAASSQEPSGTTLDTLLPGDDMRNHTDAMAQDIVHPRTRSVPTVNQHAVHSPHVFCTDFTLVNRVLAAEGLVLPLGCRIYHNMVAGTWVARCQPRSCGPPITRSASLSKFRTDAAAIVEAYRRLRTKCFK